VAQLAETGKRPKEGVGLGETVLEVVSVQTGLVPAVTRRETVPKVVLVNVGLLLAAFSNQAYVLMGCEQLALSTMEPPGQNSAGFGLIAKVGIFTILEAVAEQLFPSFTVTV
jgi:hypothetical protein